MEFLNLVEDEASRIEAIAEWLDAASPEERMAATRTLSRNAQRSLYGKAESAMSLEDLDPSGRGDREQVIHHGWKHPSLTNTTVCPTRIGNDSGGFVPTQRCPCVRHGPC